MGRGNSRVCVCVCVCVCVQKLSRHAARQVARLYAALAPGVAPGDHLLTSDADLVPLDPAHFGVERDWSKVKP